MGSAAYLAPCVVVVFCIGTFHIKFMLARYVAKPVKQKNHQTHKKICGSSRRAACSNQTVLASFFDFSGELAGLYPPQKIADSFTSEEA